MSAWSSRRCGKSPMLPPIRCSGLWDTASSHQGETSVKRLEGEWRNLRLIHPPVHASWLN